MEVMHKFFTSAYLISSCFGEYLITSAVLVLQNKRHLVYSVKWLALGKPSSCRIHAKEDTGARLSPLATKTVKLSSPCQHEKWIVNADVDNISHFAHNLFPVPTSLKVGTIQGQQN